MPIYTIHSVLAASILLTIFSSCAVGEKRNGMVCNEKSDISAFCEENNTAKKRVRDSIIDELFDRVEVQAIQLLNDKQRDISKGKGIVKCKYILNGTEVQRVLIFKEGVGPNSINVLMEFKSGPIIHIAKSSVQSNDLKVNPEIQFELIEEPAGTRADAIFQMYTLNEERIIKSSLAIIRGLQIKEDIKRTKDMHKIPLDPQRPTN